MEVLEPEVHFAPHLEHAGNREFLGRGESFGDVVDRESVERDLLAGAAVAAGGGPAQPAVLVHQAQRDAVDLHLAEVVQVRAGLGFHAGDPGPQLVLGEDVVEAEHPFEVVDGGEVGGEAAPDELGGGIGDAQVRVVVLELLQRAEQLVEGTVGDDRRIAHVVTELVLAHLLRELLPALTHVGRSLGGRVRRFTHAGKTSRAIRRSRPLRTRASRDRP